MNGRDILHFWKILRKKLKLKKQKALSKIRFQIYTCRFCSGKMSHKNQGECWAFNMRVKMEGSSERILHEFPGYKLHNFLFQSLTDSSQIVL